MLRLAAILILVSAPAAFLWPGRPAAGLSLDDVREAVDRAKTVCHTLQQVIIDGGKPLAEPRKSRILIRAPSLIRTEMEEGFGIVDTEAWRSIHVNPAEKTVTLVENLKEARGEVPGDLGVYFHDMVRGLADREAEPLGTRRIDGREAVGFRVEGPLPPHENPPPFPTTSDVWVDRETQLPLEVIMTTTLGEAVVIVTMTDFEFDRDLDPSLFSFEPPEGFEVRRIGVPELKPAPPKEEAAALTLTGSSLGPVRLGATKQECLDAFGEPDRVDDFGRGEVLEYDSRGFSLTIDREGGLRMITCFSGHGMGFAVRPFEGRTAEGIALGADREAIEAVYGEPADVHVTRLRDVFGDATPKPDEPTGQVSLTYPDRGLTFTLHDDELYNIIAQPMGGDPPRGD